MGAISPCLWFDTEAEDAARHYCAIFAESRIDRIEHYGEGMHKPAGSVMVVDFTLRGQSFQALNGGPGVPHSDAISLSVECADQAELDRVWDGLIAGGGAPVMCGWLKDRFGVSWQVVPSIWNRLIGSGTPVQRQRMMQALLGMVKLDAAALEAAFWGE